ncbi:MAG: AAA family ATPase [Dongiaceae bacterium]
MARSLPAFRFLEELRNLLTARHPIVHVTTFEEDRLLKEIEIVASKLSRKVHIWSTSRGIYALRKSDNSNKGALNPAADLVGAIETFEKLAERSIHDSQGYLFILLDPYPYLSNRGANPIYRRRLRDFAIAIRTKGYQASCLIVAPSANLPYELEKEVAILDFPLPGREEISDLVRGFMKAVKSSPGLSLAEDSHEELMRALVDASLGLTHMEVQSALASAVVDDRRLDWEDVEKITGQKRQIIRKSGILDFCDTAGLSIDHVGGMARLKDWLRTRRAAFSVEGRNFGIKPPRGVLLTGIPGCGKSWSAKCVAASWRLPLIRLDMGKVYSSLVGSSEEHLRTAMQTAEAVAPCVLWIDEIEKGLSASRGYIGDSGVSLRVLGGFLTWLQEKTAAVFVFATANEIDLLPPELLRKGRFDEIFFVDLPTDEERRQIIRIHLLETGRDPKNFNLDELARLSGDQRLGSGIALTGAEIEAWINESLIHAFYRSNGKACELQTDDLMAVLDRLVPLAQIRSEEIQEMRHWAATHARSASDADTVENDRIALHGV